MKRTLRAMAVIAFMIGSLNVFALDDKSDVGTVVGGVIGGVVGNEIGGGFIGTGIGIIVGAAIGNSVGASLDRADQRALQDAQNRALYAPVGTYADWNGNNYGSRTGARGRFVTTRDGYHRNYTNETCRSYRSEIVSRGKSEVRTGTTCRRANGSWYEVNSSEVYFR